VSPRLKVISSACDNVIAGSDCGFGTWVGQAAVDPDVVWAKLSAMAEGARLATKQFWGG
jgi:5-methyltetrahydropteroyltriglutamate--homocysteine methyltransferase